MCGIVFFVDTILCFWKFDDDFRFQLTREEYHEILMSKKLTSKLNVNDSLSNNNETNSILRSKKLTLELRQGKYSKYLPYVFTEQGIYMLMIVLKGDLAVRQSKALIRTFKEMKDFISENRSLVGGRELLQLSLQTTKNTEDIAVIKQNPNTNITFTKTCGIRESVRLAFSVFPLVHLLPNFLIC